MSTNLLFLGDQENRQQDQCYDDKYSCDPNSLR